MTSTKSLGKMKPMRSFSLLLYGCILAKCAIATGPATNESDRTAMTEDQKIEGLISAVQNLKDASFVRNGKEYDGKAASDHLRSKWTRGRKHIKTARDFIKLAASTSSQSGQPYIIRFKDGKEVKSADFLGEALDHLEHPENSSTTKPNGSWN